MCLQLNANVLYQNFRMKLNDIYNCVEEKIGHVFEAYGRFVANHAVKVLVATIIINIALGVGMIRLKKESDTEKVYFPMGKLIIGQSHSHGNSGNLRAFRRSTMTYIYVQENINKFLFLI